MVLYLSFMFVFRESLAPTDGIASGFRKRSGKRSAKLTRTVKRHSWRTWNAAWQSLREVTKSTRWRDRASRDQMGSPPASVAATKPRPETWRYWSTVRWSSSCCDAGDRPALIQPSSA